MCIIHQLIIVYDTYHCSCNETYFNHVPNSILWSSFPQYNGSLWYYVYLTIVIHSLLTSQDYHVVKPDTLIKSHCFYIGWSKKFTCFETRRRYSCKRPVTFSFHPCNKNHCRDDNQCSNEQENNIYCESCTAVVDCKKQKSECNSNNFKLFKSF